MNLEKGYLYHIYNQGNNQRKIFFKQENYIFFLKKIKIHLSPYVDVIAWCLMPNHFHLMVLVKDDLSEGFILSETLTTKTINDSIGVMLRSYTRAINKQENFSGSLFRKETKAECVNSPSFKFSQGFTLSETLTEKQYPQVCFDYIHQNPVKAGIVKKAEDYEFSSAKDYAGLRNNKLTNKKVALEHVDYIKSSQSFTLSETLTPSETLKNFHSDTHTVTPSHGVSSKTQKNPELELALNFVEKTDRNIFLTGKAGTGKTTFLHKIKTESNKRLVVVAPTGVAAINAKGVTIHSFFQMPFGPIIPGVEKKSKFRFGKVKIDIIRSLDLLIIDEISMVRADLLDGIDQVLRRYKNRNKVFGGVQVLMIGDLQQLAPVVKPYEWQMLSAHYKTMYFFSSHAFQKANPVSIELKHIYRQADENFIKILNEVRNDKLSDTSAKILNQRYQPDFTPKKDDGYITLTTHNNRANAINEAELNKISLNKHYYSAKIKGKFNEHAYPTKEKLELKIGAQVMFIKNDSSYEKRYYNGKIGTVTKLEKDTVWVKCKDDDEIIETIPEIWENVVYAINNETKEIKEEIAGSFSQIPLRLAWAITIHKSQGLTFDKAIIDAEASFAHGQTYVALSRCKTLEGIILKTKITNNAIINDSKVVDFTNEVEENLPNAKDLSNSQKAYQLNVMDDLFNYQAFLYPIQRLIKIYYENKTSFRGNILEPLNIIKDNGIVKLMQVATSFKNQLVGLSETITNPEEDKTVQERIHKGIHYFIEHTLEHLKKPFDDITFSTDNKTVKKDFTKQLDNFEDLLSTKLTCLWGLSKGFSTSKYLELRAKAVLEKTETTTSSSKKKGKKRAEVVDTEHPILFEQLRELRRITANEMNCPPFQVFTQITLFELCAYFPKTPKELLKINGMGKIRVEKHGEDILKIINKYVSENEVAAKEVVYVDAPESKDTKPKEVSTKQHSLNLFKSGKSIKEIAEERELTVNTISNHLISFIPTGEIKITDIMPMKKYEELKKIVQKTKYESLSELKNKIDAKFTYAELRLVTVDKK